jgi:CspA family cold shock protein
MSRHIREHSRIPKWRDHDDDWPPRPAREPNKPGERMTGVVVAWSADKQFGWIKPDNGGQDIFVHARQVEYSHVGKLAVNDHLEFSVKLGDNGRVSAQNLKRVEIAT